MGKLTHTVKGPIASFRSADVAPIESLKIHFLPKQEGSGDASPQNIRNITGWTGCNLNKAKKNLIEPDYVTETVQKGLTISPSTNGIRVSGTASTRTAVRLSKSSKKTKLGVGDKVTFSLYLSGDISECELPFLGYYKSNGVWGGVIGQLSSNNNWKITWTVPNTYTDDSILDSYIYVPQGVTVNFEIGLQGIISPYYSDSYEPYYVETIPLSWSSHGVEYGGYIDPVRGKLVAEYEFMTDTWGNWGVSQNMGDGTVLRVKRFTNPVYGNGIGHHNTDYCNVAKYVYANQNGKTHYYIVGSSYNCRMFMPEDMSTNQVIQVIGKLITPIEYDLTSTEMKTFLDYNNFWSDMNDDTEVEYCFADRLSERKLIMNTPHIESISGSVASFNTDLKAPIVDLKAHFTPIQEGTGTPGPQNIRNIVGRTGCNVLNDPAYPGFIDWNQLQQDGNFEDINKWEVGNDYGVMSIESNVMKWTCTQQPTQFYHTGFRIKNGSGNSNFLSIPYDHKVLVIAMVRCSVSTRIRIYGLVSTTGNTYIYSYTNGNQNIPANEWTKMCGFISNRPSTPPSSATDVIIKRFKPTLIGTDGDISTIVVGTTFEMKNFMAFDLTQMFGAGNEPSVSEFEAMFDLSTYKAYNLGQKTTVASLNGSDPTIVSVAFPAMKNLFDAMQYGRVDGCAGFTASEGSYSVTQVNGGNSCLVWGTQVFPAGTYTLNAKVFGDGTNGFRLLCSSSSCGGTYNSYYRGYYLNSSNNNSKITFTTTESFTIGIVLLSNSSHEREAGGIEYIQLERGSSSTDYQPYKTAFFGYIDLINGKLIATHKQFILTGYENIEYSAFRGSVYTAFSEKSILSDSKHGDSIYGMCNMISRGNTTTNQIQRAYLRKSYDGYGLQFYYLTSYWGLTESTVEAFVAKLKALSDAGTPFQLVYELATPIEYDLTPETLKSLIGQNNIFADTNGDVDVKYWSH